MSFYAWSVRPALFALDAERAHDLTMAALSQPALSGMLRLFPAPPPDDRLAQRVWGTSFAHPVGLAAGLDKQGTAVPAWAALGFAFAEIGTVTPRPQPGNPKPRLFRLPQDLAIINRFGFNSRGAEAVARNLSSYAAPGIRVGVNLGKNKETPNERATEDYVAAVEALHRFADYFVINVSSPNTAGLRDLQESRALRSLVEQVSGRVRELTKVPVLVKVSPDMEAATLLESVDAAIAGGASGVIATNTTIGRSGLTTHGPVVREAGGLSGAVLRDTAHDACRTLFRHLGRQVPIVGVGGIFTADDAYQRIRAGAALVQLYTALVYEGPGVIGRIVRGIGERLRHDGFSSIEEAIGVDVR